MPMRVGIDALLPHFGHIGLIVSLELVISFPLLPVGIAGLSGPRYVSLHLAANSGAP